MVQCVSHCPLGSSRCTCNLQCLRDSGSSKLLMKCLHRSWCWLFHSFQVAVDFSAIEIEKEEFLSQLCSWRLIFRSSWHSMGKWNQWSEVSLRKVVTHTFRMLSYDTHSWVLTVWVEKWKKWTELRCSKASREWKWLDQVERFNTVGEHCVPSKEDVRGRKAPHFD